jgi:hypothetical protein
MHASVWRVRLVNKSNAAFVFRGSTGTALTRGRDECGWDRSRKRACRVGKKVPPSERPAHSVTHQHRGFRVRQHLVCNTAEHNCG